MAALLHWFRLPRTRRARWAVITAILFILVAGGVLTLYLVRPEVYSYTLTVPPRADQPGVELEYGSKPALTDYSFFTQVRDQFIDQDAQFLSVNLNEMRIELYENGEKQLEVPVKAKGERGSWWETPAGLYKIRTKERDHITSFGGLHMPWSMQFHGNFFIHGWPYFDDGREVTGDTSAGCIRLSDESAQKLYSQVSVGTPVLVYEKGMTETDTAYTYTSRGLDVSADSYLVADIKNHQALARKNPRATQELGALSSLLVGLTAAEQYALEDQMYAPSDIATSSVLEGGKAYRAYDLFFPLLQTSSAPAARALAAYRGTDWFTRAVNERATSLGMSNTNIESVDDFTQNTSSPRDMFALSKYLYNYRSFLLTIAAGTVNTQVYGTPRVAVENENRFSDRIAYKGGVTLPSATSSASLAVFNMPFNDTKRPIAFIVMGSSQPADDIEQMYNHVRRTYTLRERSDLTADQLPSVSRTKSLEQELQGQQASVLNAVKQILP